MIQILSVSLYSKHKVIQITFVSLHVRHEEPKKGVRLVWI